MPILQDDVRRLRQEFAGSSDQVFDASSDGELPFNPFRLLPWPPWLTVDPLYLQHETFVIEGKHGDYSVSHGSSERSTAGLLESKMRPLVRLTDADRADLVIWKRGPADLTKSIVEEQFHGMAALDDQQVPMYAALETMLRNGSFSRRSDGYIDQLVVQPVSNRGELPYQVSNNSLKYLDNLWELRKLTINSEHVTDMGLSHLVTFEGLEHLDISATNIVGSNADDLERIKSLKTLILGPAVPDDRLEHLRRQLPDVDVSRKSATPR